MTCLEKLKLEHPGAIDREWNFPDTCPEEHGYKPAYNRCTCSDDCIKCWNSECVNDGEKYNPVQKAYDLVLKFREACDTETELDLDDLIGYLGEALDDRPETAYTDVATMLSDVVKSEVSSEPTIKDSGDRTQFASGAVRDMREGKGRFDISPLEVIANYIDGDNDSYDAVLWNMAMFLRTNSTSYLYSALKEFEYNAYTDKYSMLLDVAIHFEQGAKKYGEANYRLGIPTKFYIDSAVRHYMKWRRGDKDEPHNRAFVWNVLCCIWEVDYGEEWRSTVKVKEAN